MTLTGAQILSLLERQWQGPEQSVLQVSRGFGYAWDPALPPGSRVVPGSVTIHGQPMRLDASVPGHGEQLPRGRRRRDRRPARRAATAPAARTPGKRSSATSRSALPSRRPASGAYATWRAGRSMRSRRATLSGNSKRGNPSRRGPLISRTMHGCSRCAAAVAARRRAGQAQTDNYPGEAGAHHRAVSARRHRRLYLRGCWPPSSPRASASSSSSTIAPAPPAP